MRAPVKLKGAFRAGLMRNLGQGLVEGVREREARREKYLDLAIDNARRLAPAYAQSEAEISQMEDMMEQMNNDFGITPEEFIGLAQNYDVNDIYKNVYTAKAVMEKNNIRGQIDKSMILGSLNLPKQFELPEGVTPEKALRMIFQGVTQYTDPNNKSESHRAGAFGKAVTDMLALNPRASAEDMLKGMQIAGVPIEKIRAFEAAGGIKQTPFSSLKAKSPYEAIDIDYTDAQFKTTTNAFASIFSRKFAGTDDPLDLATLLSKNPAALNAFGADTTADAAYAEVFSGGQTMARLEKALIAKGLGVGFGQANARYDAMAGMAQRLESVEEMRTLVKLIEQDTQLANRVVEVYGNDQMITDKEMDYILTGTRTKDPIEVSTETPEVVVSEDQKQRSEAEKQASLLFPDDPTILGATTEEMTLPTTDDRELPTMEGRGNLQFPEDTKDDTAFSNIVKVVANKYDVDMNATGARNRAAQLEVFRESFAQTMQDFTYEEWKEMSRQQRKDRSLPQSNFDLAMYGGGRKNFKNGTTIFESMFKEPTKTEPGDEQSRLDADGNVKPEIEELERVELQSDIDAAIISDASEASAEFNDRADAEAFVDRWIKDNMPDTPEGYEKSIIVNALMMVYGKNPDDPTTTTQTDTQTNSIVDDILNN
mgnify:CR=1 FL=1